MAITTPSMGLKRWDQPNDVFSYVELSDNWALLDGHDHTSGKGVQIPTGGIANLAVDATKLANDSVTAVKIPVNTLTGDRLVNATLADTKLQSPNNSVWKNLFQMTGSFGGNVAAGTYVFTHSGLVLSGANNTGAALLLPWDDADYLVASKAIKLRLIGVVATNTTAPGVTFSLGLHPISSGAGSNNNLSITTSAAVAGSPIAVATPGASSRSILTGAQFDPPADGVYVAAVTSSGGTTGNTSHIGINAVLQIRHV